ncbi:MAG: C5 methylase (MAV1virus-like) protein [Mycoplasmoidaceae bacterium]
MKKKLIVWDLFGGGQNSIYKALKNNKNYEIYTFDITAPTRKLHFKIDLSQKNIVEAFKGFPKPDIIVSSTLCQSFSSVLSMKGGGTAFWKMNKDGTKLEMRTVEEFEKLKGGFTRFLKADVQEFIAKLGKKCINNTVKLIKTYKPRYWYIENPKSSLVWKYITLNKKDFYNPKTQYFNLASYGKYGFLIRKDTYFLSNIKMDLLFGKIKPIYHIELERVDESEVLDFKSRKKMYTQKEGLWYKKWYVQNGYTLNDDKKFATLFPKDAGLGILQKIDDKTKLQKNKKSNEQICESGSVSHIPAKLIKDIFSYFRAYIWE